jgi:N-methylhydantoinase A
MLARETLAGGLALDVDGARGALERLGGELGLGAEELAQGVLRVAGASMAGAIRAVSIEVGEDPREGALICYGGAGPLFASLLADELGIEKIVIPNYAGNFSAWGLLEQDVVRTAALTIVCGLDGEGIGRAQETLEGLFEALESRLEQRVAGALGHEAEFDLRYPGQEYTLTVPVALEDRRIAEDPETITRRFAAAYERSYGHSFEVGVEIESVRAIERTALPRPSDRPALESGNGAAPERHSSRAYSFAREEWCEFAVIDRDTLAPGESFEGPAIVQEATATSYLDADLKVAVHETGALVATRA